MAGLGGRSLATVSLCTFLFSVGATQAEARRIPDSNDVLEEIAPVKWSERQLPMGRKAVFSARFLDRNQTQFFWFSFTVFWEGYRADRPLMEGQYALQGEPLRESIISVYRENSDLAAGEIAERLHVMRFSLSSDTCPQLLSLTEELERHAIPIDLPKGRFTDTESYRFLFQTNSGAIEVSYDGPFPDGDPHSYLIGWFGRVRDVLQGQCSGTAVQHE